jgi:hypothetical protein
LFDTFHAAIKHVSIYITLCSFQIESIVEYNRISTGVLLTEQYSLNVLDN